MDSTLKFQSVKCWCNQTFKRQIDWNPVIEVIMILIAQMFIGFYVNMIELFQFNVVGCDTIQNDRTDCGPCRDICLGLGDSPTVGPRSII